MLRAQIADLPCICDWSRITACCRGGRRRSPSPLVDRLLRVRGLPPSKVSPKARERLVAYGWPGNVRELENALERALILAGVDEIGPGLLTLASPFGQEEPRRAGALLVDGFNLDVFERDLLRAALDRTGGNKSAAARLLGITRRRLYSRIESLDDTGRPEQDD